MAVVDAAEVGIGVVAVRVLEVAAGLTADIAVAVVAGGREGLVGEAEAAATAVAAAIAVAVMGRAVRAVVACVAAW